MKTKVLTLLSIAFVVASTALGANPSTAKTKVAKKTVAKAAAAKDVSHPWLAVEADITQLNVLPDLFTFRGPVNLQYHLTIKNPMAEESITLRRIALRTEGDGAYRLVVNDPVTLEIAPESTAAIDLSANATSNGGFIARAEPVTMIVQLWFVRSNGEGFMKEFVQRVSQL